MRLHIFGTSSLLLNKRAITKIQAIIIVVIVIVAAVVGIYFAIPKGPPVLNIGVLTPLSPPGDYVSGHLILQTAQLYVDWMNSQGGVAGKQLAIVQADETLDPTVAISALQRLVSGDHIVGLIGPWESVVALPVAAATEQTPVIMFVTYSWADSITRNHYKYAFRVGVYNQLIAGQSIDFFKYQGWKKIAVIVEESPYGFGQENSLKSWAAIKYPDVKFTFIPAAPGETDYSAELSRVKAMSPTPDALVIHMNVPAAFVVAKQAVEMGLTTAGMKIYFGNDCPTWDPKSFWELVGQGGVGTMFPTYYSPSMQLTPIGQQFLNLYQTKYGTAPSIALFWYWDSLRILTQAIEQTGSTDPDTLASYIQNINIQGTTGTITFQNNPDPTSILWHQWIGETQYTFEFTSFEQPASSAEQLYPTNPTSTNSTSTS